MEYNIRIINKYYIIILLFIYLYYISAKINKIANLMLTDNIICAMIFLE